jgi:AraC-like DNA-binding protein
VPGKVGSEIASPTVSVFIVRAIFMAAVERGMSPPELCERFRITPELLAQDEGRVSARAVMAIWEEVPHACGDPAFGIHLGEQVAIPPHPVLGYALRHSANLGDALHCFFRFQRLVQNVASTRLTTHPQGSRMTVHEAPGVGRLPSQAIEHAFAATIALGRRLTGVENVCPRAVFFAHPAPADVREHERIFRAPVHFESEGHAMEFGPEMLALPLPDADPGLRRVLENYARTLADEVPVAASDLASRVRVEVRDAIPKGRSDLASIAKTLAMGERTLQRRLREEGTSHQQIFDEERALVAEHYVRSSSLSLLEIAFMLGFGDQAAFHRAFVRWTGKTPGHLRGGRGLSGEPTALRSKAKR